MNTTSSEWLAFLKDYAAAIQTVLAVCAAIVGAGWAVYRHWTTRQSPSPSGNAPGTAQPSNPADSATRNAASNSKPVAKGTILILAAHLLPSCVTGIGWTIWAAVLLILPTFVLNILFGPKIFLAYGLLLQVLLPIVSGASIGTRTKGQSAAVITVAGSLAGLLSLAVETMLLIVIVELWTQSPSSVLASSMSRAGIFSTVCLMILISAGLGAIGASGENK